MNFENTFLEIIFSVVMFDFSFYEHFLFGWMVLKTLQFEFSYIYQYI